MKTIDEVLFHALYEIVLGTADPEAAIRYLKDQLDKAGYEIAKKPKRSYVPGIAGQ